MLGRHFRVPGERVLAEKLQSAGAMERARSGKLAAGDGDGDGDGAGGGQFERRLETRRRRRRGGTEVRNKWATSTPRLQRSSFYWKFKGIRPAEIRERAAKNGR